MLSREYLEVTAAEVPAQAGVTRLCAHCAAYLRQDQQCSCSNAGMVYDLVTRDFTVPLVGDPVDRIVVERERAMHGLQGIAVGGVEDEPPARVPVKRQRARGRFTQHRSETSIQDGCKQTFMLRGYVVVTTASKYMQNGTPDLLGCVDGRMVAVEVKRPGEVPRPDQMGELRKWRKAGALAGWVCDEQDLLDLLTHLADGEWINPLTGPGDGRRA